MVDLNKFTPTSENINALPEPLRKYIHDLEENLDPGFIIQENIALKQQNEELLEKLQMTQIEIKGLRDELNLRKDVDLNTIKRITGQEYTEKLEKRIEELKELIKIGFCDRCGHDCDIGLSCDIKNALKKLGGE